MRQVHLTPLEGEVYRGLAGEPRVSEDTHMSALRTWMRWGVWIFALGGALWVLKVIMITLNYLMDRDVDAFGVPVLYLTAVALLFFGATAVGIALLRRYSWRVQLLGAVLAIPALIFGYSAIDALLKAALGDVGPWWLPDELGIVATGAVCLVGGVLLGRTTSPDSS
jgi:hypothetical protein